MKQGSRLSQTQLLRQRLLPQQLRLVALVEKTDEEVEQEIAREVEENPALERVGGPVRISAGAYSAGADDRPETPDFDETLAEALDGQLAEVTDLDPTVKALTAYMIGALDSNGYLTRTLPQLKTDIELLGTIAFTEAQLRQAYTRLRSLDPAGVGAQDLRDCLLLQLTRQDRSGDATEIVRHFFDIYSHRNFRRLAEATGMSLERVKAADEIIRSLNPKPGAPYASDPVQALARSAVQPDFIVETDGKRAWISLPNSLPELRLEQSFAVDPENPEAARFVRDRRGQALSFIDALRRRQETLLSIGRAIVELQAPFFTSADDERRIRPMVLRQIADTTGLDLTMVSRAVAGKWLATQWGVYPLKFFFNHRSGAADEATSAREIEAAIRDLVENETEPLTDDALAEALSKQGYKVARRTVAKYRSRLNILPARLRLSRK